MNYSIYDEQSQNESSLVESTRSSRLGSLESSYVGIGETLQSLKPLLNQSTLEAFISILTASGLPGPAVLLGNTDYIGCGSQFVVHQQSLLWTTNASESWGERLVATKQPKFPLDPKSKLSLAGPAIQRHLDHILLEITAMRDAKLRTHPNIANLIGWSFQTGDFHRPIVLLMELAKDNLAKYLGDNAGKISLDWNLCIFQDIASGLDAIHARKLVHGDLKPENILLFLEGARLVAKLADFGLSVEASSSIGKVHIGGTVGWQAPEVESGRLLELVELPRTDNYSFGLLIWSALLYDGKKPPGSKETRQDMAKGQVLSILEEPDLETYSFLPQAVFCLLEDIDKRPEIVEELLRNGKNDASPSNEPPHSSADSREKDIGFITTSINQRKKFIFERPCLSSDFAIDLFARFQQDPKHIAGDLLFAMYLVSTRLRLDSTIPRSTTLDVLVASALQGYEPAQATVLIAFESFETELPLEIQNNIPKWLERGVASGSPIAGKALKMVDANSFDASIAKFWATGGYNWIYSGINKSPSHSRAAGKEGHTKLHYLVTYGLVEDVANCLNSDSHLINVMTDNQETPLYLACLRGSWSIIEELLKHGACPRIRCTAFEISCLHWIFSIDAEFQAIAVAELVHHGADLNALVTREVPFFHFPFVLPLGAPLHWAIATGTQRTISVLIKAGAGLILRNGADPYIVDQRVRILDKFDGPDQETFSVPQMPPQGLSPLDLAAMQCEAFVFETVLNLSLKVDINAVDEEGFSVLHRLSCNTQGRTSSGGVFNHSAFMGSKKTRTENLRRTVSAIKALGGNMEQLTRPMEPGARKTSQGLIMPNYTPLMLAFLNPSPEVMSALLDMGADVNTKNVMGKTAIGCLPHHSPDFSGECARILMSKGAQWDRQNFLIEAPIITAAYYALIEVVEAMLKAGADIDERICDKGGQRDGANMFSSLARSDTDDWDASIARLLHEYVFSCPDVEKRRRVVDVGDRDGETLLHCFAKSGMPRCVKLLLDDRADANARQKMFRMVPKSPNTGSRIIWYETPLDKVMIFRDLRKLWMRRFSQETYEKNSQKDKEIIEMLKNAGGISIRAHTVEEDYQYDGPPGGLIAYLRTHV